MNEGKTLSSVGTRLENADANVVIYHTLRLINHVLLDNYQSEIDVCCLLKLMVDEVGRSLPSPSGLAA